MRGEDLAIVAGDRSVDPSGFVGANGVFHGCGGFDHLEVFGEGGKFLRFDLGAHIKGIHRLNERHLEIEARESRSSAHLAQGGDHGNLAGRNDEQSLPQQQQRAENDGNHHGEAIGGIVDPSWGLHDGPRS